jgi:hypothetical protein
MPEFRDWLIDFGDSGYVALYHFDGETAAIPAVLGAMSSTGRLMCGW